MPIRAVITGGGGFVAQWITRALLRRGDDVVLAGKGPRPTSPSILQADEWAATRWVRADVRSELDLKRLLATMRPDLVLHLAAMSFVPEAEREPAAAYDVNLLGAVRLLSCAAAARAAGVCDPLMLFTGSGTQYGMHPKGQPLTEVDEQRPASVYAATKAAQEIAALQLSHSTGMRVICTRSFNHAGIGQPPQFLLPSLVARIRDLPRRGGVVRIGNDVIRDYLHVEDVISAYLALAERGGPGTVYNVCSGSGVSVSALAREIMEVAGVEAEILSDVDLRRGGDLQVLVGSPERLVAATGWRAVKTRRDIIADLLN